ncbi:hypothetical protein ACQ4LE_005940 [Meloidogyne hapla]
MKEILFRKSLVGLVLLLAFNFVDAKQIERDTSLKTDLIQEKNIVNETTQTDDATDKLTYPGEGHEIVEVKNINSQEESFKENKKPEEQKVTMEGSIQEEETEADKAQKIENETSDDNENNIKLNEENFASNGIPKPDIPHSVVDDIEEVQEGEKEEKTIEGKNDEGKKKKVLEDEKTKEEEEDQIIREPVKKNEEATKNDEKDEELKGLKDEDEKKSEDKEMNEEEANNESKSKKDEEKKEENTKDEKEITKVIEGKKDTPKEKEHKRHHWILEKFGRVVCFITRFFCPFKSDEEKEKKEDKESLHRGKRVHSNSGSFSSEEEVIASFEKENGLSAEFEGDGELKVKMKVGATNIKSEVNESGKMRSKIEEFNAEMHN